MYRIWLILALFLCLISSAAADPEVPPLVHAPTGVPPAMLLPSAHRENSPWNIRDPRERIRAGKRVPALDSSSPKTDARSLDLLGSNFPIASFADDVTGTTELDSAVVAYNSRRNSFLVVWHGFDLVTGFDLYAREVSATGAMLTAPYALRQDTGDQGWPALAYDGTNDQYWLAWTAPHGSNWGIYVQRLSGLGQPVGNPLLVSAPGVDSTEAHIACSAQRCLVTFTTVTAETSWIEARVLDAAGNAVTGVVRLSPPGVEASTSDAVYNASDDVFLAVWDQNNPTTGWDIAGQALNASGVPIGGVLTIYSGPQIQSWPKVAYNAVSGRYCVVWQDGRNGANWDIYAQILQRNHTLQGTAFPVYTGAYHDNEPSVAAHNTRDQFMVVFSRELTAWGVPAIHAATVTGAGAVTGNMQIHSAANTRWGARIAHHSGSDEYLVVWMDNVTNAEADVFGQRVRYDRALSGSLLVICRGRKGQEYPGVAYNRKHNRYLVVWQDYRSGNTYDIRGRVLAPDGTLLGQEIIIYQGGQLSSWPVATALDDRDDWMVAWITLGAQYVEVRGRRVGVNGQLLGSDLYVSRDVPTYAGGGVRIAANPARNEYLVGWFAFTNGSYNVYAQRLSTDGNFLGSNFPICEAADDQYFNDVVYNAQSSEYVAVWLDFRNTPNGQAYARRISGAGVPTGADTLLTAASARLQDPRLVWNPLNNEYLLTYADVGTQAVICTMRFGSDLTSLGSPRSVTDPSWWSWWPMAAQNSLSHEYLVLWLQYFPDTYSDVIGAQLGLDGVRRVNPFAVALQPDLQQAPALAQNTANGEFLFVWMDARNISWDIYGQRWTNPIRNWFYLPVIWRP